MQPSRMNRVRTAGFTLIELVVVITILGILAAFAIPRFITLDSTARSATVNGLAGSISSAAALAHSLSVATSASVSVTMEGQTVNLLNNYPDATSNGIQNAVNFSSSDFSYAAGGSASGTATFSRVGAASNCNVTYTPPAAPGGAPTVTPTTSGC
jgi:MSHA pilin protein MshA